MNDSPTSLNPTIAEKGTIALAKRTVRILGHTKHISLPIASVVAAALWIQVKITAIEEKIDRLLMYQSIQRLLDRHPVDRADP